MARPGVREARRIDPDRAASTEKCEHCVGPLRVAMVQLPARDRDTMICADGRRRRQNPSNRPIPYRNRRVDRLREAPSHVRSPGSSSDMCVVGREPSMRPRIPLTMDDSAHPGCNRDDRTSNVYSERRIVENIPGAGHSIRQRGEHRRLTPASIADQSATTRGRLPGRARVHERLFDCMSSSPRFVLPPRVADAWPRTVAFFKRHLK